MTPPKFKTPSHFTRKTRSTNKLMEEMTKVVYVEDISSTKSESVSMTLVEEKNPKYEAADVN
jgi:hypothetical protein